ncbi:MAG: YggS family pyridoxal phosphate-dependent enzyme [Clostridia bacterium]|nr:YggS family pyridoxal phosphate-dependent enzyme [Clostridia bacterium]
MTKFDTIRDNLKRVEENVARAKEASPSKRDVKILLATKTVSVENILYATDGLGYRLIGENRVPELLSKYDGLKDHADIHLIGHLQTNKVKSVVGKVSLIESVDSVRLANEIDRRSAEAGTVSDVLVEINIGKEEAKGGVMPEAADEFFSQLADFKNIRPRGIMTMAPRCDKKSDYHKFFGKTYEIFLDISGKYLYNIIEPVLSMGMSESYEEAVAEGATEIRVGSAVFGARIYS